MEIHLHIIDIQILVLKFGKKILLFRAYMVLILQREIGEPITIGMQSIVEVLLMVVDVFC